VQALPNPACAFVWPSELDLRRFILIVLRPEIWEVSMLEAPAPYEPTGNSRVLFREILLARCASQRVTAQSL
jgi:hypothetical protein